MDAVQTLLLRRQGLVFLDGEPQLAAITLHGDFGAAVKVLIERQGWSPAPAAGLGRSAVAIAPLEYQLLTLGYVMRGELQQRLRQLPLEEFAIISHWLCTTLVGAVGGDRRSGAEGCHWFESPRERYIQRLLAVVRQSPEQSCLSCGCLAWVTVLNPCGHMLCASCGDTISFCPICDQRIVVEAPLLYPPALGAAAAASAASTRLKVLHLGSQRKFAVQSLFQRLLLRPTPLSPQDQADLQVLVRVVPEPVLAWVPQRIPQPETMAVLFGTLLQNASGRAVTIAAAQSHIHTATDVLRVVMVWMGGGTDLSIAPPLHSMPRSLRRDLLALLEALPVAQLMAEMPCHGRLWKRVGEILHPFEFYRRYPNCALAFAVLRRTRVDRAAAMGTALPVAEGESLSLPQTLMQAAAPLAPAVEFKDTRWRWRG